MSIIGNFIGVGKHVDPEIRDLPGAKKDATALWALFNDTIRGIQSRLVIDEEATTEAISGILKKTLDEAGPDDTVIISFAGHGTHEHQLVAYNSVISNLANSTLSMSEIAKYFKNSKAGKLLFIVDCCFSGGAPARVLEDSPIPRDIRNPFDEFKGEGRVMVAAANFNEVAYELPGSGHGILTKALIDVMQSGKEQNEILSVMEEVITRVRTEAQKLGRTQTPVIITQVTGGFVIPKLGKGNKYFNAFPEAKGIKISSDIKDLSKFNLPKNLLEAWIDQFKNGLNDLQLAAINDYRILDGESLLVVAPTSSGKTFIGEMASAKAMMEGRKSVFLFPYRALASEKFEQFSDLYGTLLGMRVIRCTGDYADQIKPFIKGKYDIALLTYEMFLNLMLNNPWVLNDIGLIVVDEAQFIADPSRGITVELLLTYLLAAREKSVAPQIITLSAVIGEINNFDAWIGCQKLVTVKRPVPLIEGVLDRQGVYQYVDVTTGKEERKTLLSRSSIRQRRNKPSSQDIIVPLVKQLLIENKNEKIIIFRNKRGSAEGCANYLSQDLGLPPALDVLQLLPNHDLASSSVNLRTCLQGGTAFHNTNLNREEKVLIENAFRNPESKVRVLGATTTVAAGVNTPASTVIIAELKFANNREFTVAEYKNMAGRAGRVGFHEEGKSIILAETSYERELFFQKYVKGNLGSLKSSFDPQHIDTWIVRLLAQIEQIPRGEIVHLLANTYGGYLSSRINPKWKNETSNILKNILEEMINLGLAEEEGGNIQLTLLGRACGNSALSFKTAMRLISFLKELEPKSVSAEHLMVLVQASPELDGSNTPIMRRGTKEAIRQREAIQKYDPEIIRMLQRYVPSNMDYYARCKRAAILWDWIHGLTVENIEAQYSTNPYQGKIGYGDIRKIADTTRFHLRAAYQIANVMFLGEGPDEEEIETILKQLEVGLPADALGLLDIHPPLERGECLLLYQQNIKTKDQFKATPIRDLKKILPATKIHNFENSAKNLHTNTEKT